MVGAYWGLLSLSLFDVNNLSGISLVVVLIFIFLSSMVFCAILGFIIEKVAYKPLRNSPRLAPLITAVGVSIVLQNLVMLIAGTDNKSFPFIFIRGDIKIGEVSIPYIQLFIIIISVILMVSLHIFIKNTKLGKAMRAVSEDKKTAGLMGINVDWIISLTFLIGSSLAAAAGVMVGIYYGMINFTMGYIAGLKAFTAAVLGGIGNIPGAMFGGVLLGVLESFGAGFISAEYKDVFAFCILIFVLIFKPSGLLGERVTK
jgi:branched-chain amino acid transport system permease protein